MSISEERASVAKESPHLSHIGSLYKEDGSPNSKHELSIFVDDPRATGHELTQGGLLGVGVEDEHDEGAQINLAKEDDSYLNEFRANSQHGWNQAINAVVGGVAKGSMTAIEDLSYLTVGGANTVKSLLGYERAEHNAVSKWASERKEELDKAFPIFRTNPGETIDMSDPGFYWQSLSSLLDSAVGFGAAGGVIGTASKAAAIARLGKIGTKIIPQVLGGTAMNLAEGKTIAVEAYKKGVEEDTRLIDSKIEMERKAIEDGLRRQLAKFMQGEGTHLVKRTNGPEGQTEAVRVINGTLTTPEEWYRQKAEEADQKLEARKLDLLKDSAEARGEQSNKIQQVNIPLILTNMLHMRGIMGAQHALRRRSIQSLGQRAAAALSSRKGLQKTVKETLLQGSGEAFEEAYQQVGELETSYQAKRKQGLTKKVGAIDRYFDHITSDETKLSAALGFLGGPIQTVGTTMVHDTRERLFGGAKRRRQYNESVRQNQNYVQGMYDEYISNNFNQNRDNYDQRVEALRNGDTEASYQLQQESFADLFYNAAQAGQLNTLEDNLSELRQRTDEEVADQNLDKNFREQITELEAMIPQMEERYRQAEEMSTEDGEIDPTQRKVLYDMGIRADLARQAHERLSQEYEQKFNQTIESVNEERIADEDRISTAQQEVQRRKDEIEAYEKRLEDLQEKRKAVRRAYNRNARSSGRMNNLMDNVMNEVRGREIRNTTDKINDLTRDLRQLEQELQTEEKSASDLENAIRNKPEYAQSKDALDKVTQVETAARLYESTLEEFSKPKNKRELSDAQTELFANIAEEMHSAQQRIDALATLSVETARARRRAVDDVVNDQHLNNFRQNNKVDETILHDIADKVARYQRLTERESEIAIANAENINMRMHSLRDVYNQERKQTFQDNLGQFDNDITTESITVEQTADNLVNTMVDNDLAVTAEEAAFETLPELRQKVENEEILPPDNTTKEEYIKELDKAITEAQKKHKPKVQETTQRQFDNAPINEEIAWEDEPTNTIETENNANGTPESTTDSANTQKQEGQTESKKDYYSPKLRSVNGLAFTSNLQGQSKRLRDLVGFLEDPNTDLTNYSVEYTVETDLNNVAEGSEQRAVGYYNQYLVDPKSLTKDQYKYMLEYLPIRANLMDNSGTPVQVDGEQLYGHIHSSNYKGWDLRDKSVRAQVDEFINEIRPNKIVRNVIEGKRVTAPIVEQKPGYANNQYTYEFEGTTYTLNTQDAVQEQLYRDRVKTGKITNRKPVPNSIRNVIGKDALQFGISNQDGDIATHTDGNLETQEQEVKLASNGLYFRIRAANGTYQWKPAYTREFTSEELTLGARASQGDVTVADLRNDFAEQIDRLEKILGKAPTESDIASFYNPTNRTKFNVDTSKLTDSKYVEAITEGDNPFVFTTMAALQTEGRENMDNIFIQPTTVMSTDVIIDGQPSSRPEANVETNTSPVSLRNYVRDRLSNKDAMVLLEKLFTAADRETIGRFLKDMNILALLEQNKPGMFETAIGRVFTTLTGQHPNTEFLANYFYYAWIMANSNRRDIVSKQHILGSELEKSMYPIIYAIQESLFADKATADEFTNMALNQPFEETTSTDDSFTNEQVNDAVRESVAEEVRNKARGKDVQTVPETQGTRQTAADTPTGRRKRKQVAEAEVAELLKGITGINYGTLNRINRTLGKHIRRINPKKLSLGVKETVEQAFSDAIEDIRSSKAKNKEDIIKAMIEAKKLFSSGVKAFQSDFIREYNPALSDLYENTGRPVERNEQTEKPLTIPPAPEPKVDSSTPVESPASTTTSTVETTNTAPSIDQDVEQTVEETEVTDEVLTEQNNEVEEITYPENQPRDVQETAVEMERNNAPIEQTDIVEDVRNTADEIAEQVEGWVGQTLQHIRTNLGYDSKKASSKIRLPRSKEHYRKSIDKMLALRPTTIEEWISIQDTYEFLNNNEHSIAAQVNSIEEFTRAYQEMGMVANNVFGSLSMNSTNFAQVTKEILAGIGQYYTMNDKQIETLTALNKWLLDFVGKDNLVNLDPGMIAKVIAVRDQFFTTDEGKATLPEITLKGFTPIIRTKKYKVKGDRAQDLVIGYARNGQPIFQEYINIAGVGVYRLSNVTVDQGSTLEVRSAEAQPSYVAEYSPVSQTSYTFDELINSDEQNDIPAEVQGMLEVETIVVGEGKDSFVDFREQNEMFETAPVMVDAQEVTISVNYGSGPKQVDFRVRNGEIEVRRKDSTDQKWKAPNQNHLNAYVEHLSKEYKKICP